MPNINCGVGNCAYNKNHYCHASVVKVGGEEAKITEATYCETFLNKMGYTDKMQYEQESDKIDAILCHVNTCAYNRYEHCTLHDIEIGNLREAENYMETDCLSFERR